MSQPPEFPSPDPYGPRSPADGYGQGSASSAMGGYGTSPGGPQPPQKSRKGLWIAISCIGCFVLALILVAAIVVIAALSSNDGGTSAGPTTSQSPTSSQDPSSEGPTDEPTTDEPTTDESASTADGDLGTRDEPLPAGSTVTLETESGTMDIEVGKTDFDAWPEIKKANQFNEEPGSGNVYLSAPVTVTYHGDGSITAWLDASISYVTAEGEVLELAPVVTDNSWLEAGEIYDGASSSFDVTFEAPEDEAKGGTYRIGALLNFDDDAEGWIKAE